MTLMRYIARRLERECQHPGQRDDALSLADRAAKCPPGATEDKSEVHIIAFQFIKVALLGSGYLNLSLSVRLRMCSVGAGLGGGECRGCVGLSGCSTVCARCSLCLVFTPFRGGIHT